MREELEKKLFERFSFYKRDKSIQVSLMSFGFEHGDGWFDLIWDLSEKIENVLNKYMKESAMAKSLLLGDDIFEVVQVKEKFGKLSYFYESNLKEEDEKKINEFVGEAQEKSYKTCERCGKPGTIRNTGWISCLCDDCLEEKVKF